jgi:hypothetical protein
MPRPLPAAEPEAMRSVKVEYLGIGTWKGTSNLAETANTNIRMRANATGRRRARWTAVRESPNPVTATIKKGKIAMAEEQPKQDQRTLSQRPPKPARMSGTNRLNLITSRRVVPIETSVGQTTAVRKNDAMTPNNENQPYACRHGASSRLTYPKSSKCMRLADDRWDKNKGDRGALAGLCSGRRRPRDITASMNSAT